ncbi:MAG: pyridoxal-phosphate dependent enzyme [Gemmatimonadales bacterium]|jgi:1-aminocyclopropane-1-carboxylate deaminase/D-cysteine desulfhydrase-like pyridoxal-dependent ACC family enzyme|nr:MAG: pyridoxal-phosphate dependent enzyme [Gemmatimonadales bacterium]
MRPEAIYALLDVHPRTHLTLGPTPVVHLPRLRGALGPETPELLAKLDEATGFALGGNKVRKLEYELAPPRLRGVTHLITTGGVQSNHCRVAAAAAARLGLGCVLVVNGDPPDPPTANALLHRLLGAKIRSVSTRADRQPAMEVELARIAEFGGKGLIVPLGASTPLGALGYVRGALELHEQLPAEQDRDVHVVLASSSGGTLAGLAAGFALLERTDIHLWAVSADTPAEELLSTALELATRALEELDMDPAIVQRIQPRMNTSDEEVGDGYGIPTDASREATELWARSEGMLVDPVYTSKAAAGLIRWIREGRFLAGDRIVFLHTGGHPAIFA